MIKKNDRDFYNQNGFLILRNILKANDISRIKELSRLLINVFENLSSQRIRDTENIVNKNLKDSRFTSLMFELRSQQPDIFSILYDTIQMSTKLASIANSSTILNVTSSLLDTDPNSLASYNHMMRMDFPSDQRNSYGWHQDSPYNYSNISGENALVVWFPLLDVNKKNGTLRVKPGSHLEGIHPTSFSHKHGGSRQLLVPDEVVKKYKTIDLDMNFGDVLISNNNLVHSSGNNNSDDIRYTIVTRIHKILSEDFIPGRVSFNYNLNAIKFLKNKYQDNPILSKSLDAISTFYN